MFEGGVGHNTKIIWREYFALVYPCEMYSRWFGSHLLYGDRIIKALYTVQATHEYILSGHIQCVFCEVTRFDFGLVRYA